MKKKKCIEFVWVFFFFSVQENVPNYMENTFTQISEKKKKKNFALTDKQDNIVIASYQLTEF